MTCAVGQAEAFLTSQTHEGLYHLGQGLYILVGVIVAVSAVISVVMNIKNGGIHPLEKAELEAIERERAAAAAGAEVDTDMTESKNNG